jgi:periplasmic copper chaperone A
MVRAAGGDSVRGLILSLMMMLSVTAQAAAQPAQIVVEDVWIMTPPPGATEAAAFVTVRAESADRLLSVSCACAARAEMHEMQMDGAAMRMRPLRYGAPVIPGAPLDMGPHGIHIMLVGLITPLREGDRVGLRLTFQNAGIAAVEAEVRRR